VKVLLVDDSRNIRHIQKNALKQLGCDTVEEAGDGVEALSIMAKGKPDLMLVDWMMPNMDGIALVKKIRESDKSLPIIMCTTEAEKHHVIEAIKAGVNDYLVKPFSLDALAAKVERFLGQPVSKTPTADHRI